MHALELLTETTTTYGAYDPWAPGNIIGGLIGYVILVAALWPVFVKAGHPGWAAIIPIYNTYVLVKIAGLHGAFVILYFIPLVNIVISLIVAFRIGRAFEKGGVFSFFLLWLFAIIGYFIVGYGKSRYVGPGGERSAVTA